MSVYGLCLSVYIICIIMAMMHLHHVVNDDFFQQVTRPTLKATACMGCGTGT